MKGISTEKLPRCKHLAPTLRLTLLSSTMRTNGSRYSSADVPGGEGSGVGDEGLGVDNRVCDEDNVPRS